MYERRKRQWEADAPNTAPAKYTNAMNRIARKCGV
jgi:hypothetical protein